jgi:hypothetical protein
MATSEKKKKIASKNRRKMPRYSKLALSIWVWVQRTWPFSLLLQIIWLPW